MYQVERANQLGETVSITYTDIETKEQAEAKAREMNKVICERVKNSCGSINKMRPDGTRIDLDYYRAAEQGVEATSPEN